MAKSLKSQIDNLRRSIDGLEAHRSALGDAIVDPVLAASRQQLALLEEQAAKQVVPVEERRLMTLLFMDMVGSTQIAEKLDPEDWRQILVRLHSTLGEVITAHHGTIAQYLGDGLLAFFGAKDASENDPENAIRAALDGRAAVTDLLSFEKVQLRAGVHTGLVVVGDLGAEAHKEFTASGDAINLAARVQSAAPPGGILISQDTYRYVRGVFDLTPQPPIVVKGKSEPLQTYLVRRAKPRPFRSTSRGVAGIETHTIGRWEEMQELQSAYLRAYEGHGVVWAQLLSDPGVGKSRLMADLNDWIDLREETSRLLRARSFPDDRSHPFSLVRRMWFDRFQIAEDAPLEQAESKWLARFKEFYGQEDCEEAAHALGLLVGLPFNNSPYIKAMRSDPNQVKGRSFVVSRQVFQVVRQEYPLVVLLEDLQWTDASSWEYLTEVILDREAVNYPNGLFVLGAARTEWYPPGELLDLLKASSAAGIGSEKWGVQISLTPLTERATRELAKELFQRVVNVPEQIIDLIVEHSEGVPYFAEEIVNWLVDRGILDTRSEQWLLLSEKLKEQPLPATLQHLLLTRLSSLSQQERVVLQRGAIFGRHFWNGGLEALGVSPGSEILDHLQLRGFVDEQPESSFQGDTEWSFHHNLFQVVTYESVLKRERAVLHKVAAGWLENQARLANRLDEFAGLLGDHYKRAGELTTAADWFLRAGKGAFGQGAPREAKDYYTQALEHLPPDDRERRWQLLLGREEAYSILCDIEPWKSDIAALLELASSFDDDNFLAEVYLRQTIFGGRAGDRSISQQASREALTAARRCGNQAIEAKALSLAAVLDIERGDQPTAINHIEEALHYANCSGNKSVLAFVLFRASYCFQAIGDIARSIPLQIEQIGLDNRLGNRMGEAVGLGNLGTRYIGLGQYKQARIVNEQALSIVKALGARRALAYILSNLAELYLATGDYQKAHQLLGQALIEITPSQDSGGKTIILNDLGMVLLAIGDGYGAARCFTEARELALSLQLASRVCESTAGLAACAILLGQLSEAYNYITEAWNHLREHGSTGVDYPGRVYRSCAETFDALGDIDNLRAVLESGYQVLSDIADKINIPAWRQSFIENVPDNRAILTMWERMRL